MNYFILLGKLFHTTVIIINNDFTRVTKKKDLMLPIFINLCPSITIFSLIISTFFSFAGIKKISIFSFFYSPTFLIAFFHICIDFTGSCFVCFFNYTRVFWNQESLLNSFSTSLCVISFNLVLLFHFLSELS